MTKTQKYYVVLFLGLLIALISFTNIYFLRIISNVPQTDKTSTRRYGHVNAATERAKVKTEYSNTNFHVYPILSELKRKFSPKEKHDYSSSWDLAKKWLSEGSVYSLKDKSVGSVVKALQNAKVLLAENSLKGTQLKLQLTLEGKQKVFFKPQWYERDHIIRGNIYSGKDRHNAEVVAFYLSALLDIRWVPVATSRRLHMTQDIWKVAVPQLSQTFLTANNGTKCLYGKCHYCRRNETVCGDEQGYLEGAMILLVDGHFTKYRSPWQRTYNARRQADWEIDPNFCNLVKRTHSTTRILDLVDASIFDFILQNGDRHHYETLMDRVVLLDNGKGLGNPYKDSTDILAPLYQCCMLRKSTWERLLMFSGGSLSQGLLDILDDEEASPLLTELHLRAIDRRLLTVYTTVEQCIEKYGKNEVIKNK